MRQNTWLSDYLDNPPEGFVKMLITPDMARDMLARVDRHNGKQRPFSRNNAEEWARQMSSGLWKLTHQAIAFSKEGYLIDGMHRLNAVVMSDTAQPFNVTFGWNLDTFDVIDTGKKRTASDVFGMNGVPNSGNMAAATNTIYRYDSGKMRNRGNARLSPKELYDVFLTYRSLDESLWVAGLFHKNHLAPPSLMMALHYICARKCRKDADAFFDRLGNGLFHDRTDPAYKLHCALIKNVSGHDRLSRVALAAMVINAWNGWRRNLKRVKINFDETRSFPKAY